MNEAEWLASNDPQAMLEWIANPPMLAGYPVVIDGFEHPGRPTDRKLVLFVAAVERERWEAWSNDYKEAATGIDCDLGVMEAVADGRIPMARLIETSLPYRIARTNPVECARDCVRVHNLPQDKPKWATLLRDILGNPWRPVVLDRPCERCNGTGSLTSRSGVAGAASNTCFACEAGRVGAGDWFTPAVLSIAQECYDTRDFRSLPVAADALTDAGCPADVRCPACEGAGRMVNGVFDPSNCLVCERRGRLPHPLLEHLRSPGPHVRGCWAVDLILGKR